MLMLLQQSVFQGLGTGSGPPIPFPHQIGNQTGTNISLAQSPSTLIGMQLVAFACCNGGVRSYTESVDWAERRDQGALPNLLVATKTADFNGSGSGGSAATISTSSPFCAASVAIAHGVYDAMGTTGTRSGTGSLSTPSVTLTGSGILLAAVAIENSTGSISSDTGMERIITIDPGGAYPELGIFYEYVGAGATGTRSFTIGGTAPGACSAVLVGIKKG